VVSRSAKRRRRDRCRHRLQQWLCPRPLLPISVDDQVQRRPDERRERLPFAGRDV